VSLSSQIYYVGTSYDELTSKLSEDRRAIQKLQSLTRRPDSATLEVGTTSSPDRNYEDYVLIWLAEDEETLTSCTHLQQKLRECINYLRTYTDPHQCENFIDCRPSQDEKIVLLIAEKYVSQVLLCNGDSITAVYVHLQQSPASNVSQSWVERYEEKVSIQYKVRKPYIFSLFSRFRSASSVLNTLNWLRSSLLSKKSVKKPTVLLSTSHSIPTTVNRHPAASKATIFGSNSSLQCLPE
jgi:hypothetical protein